MPEVPIIEGQDAIASMSKTEDPQRLVKLINESIRESDANKVKFGYSSKVEKYDQLYQNKLYDGAAQGHLYFESRANYYREWVDGCATILNREPLHDIVLRRDQEPASITADVLTRIIEYCHYYNKRDLKFHDWCVNAGKYGNGIMRVFYNPDADDFQGLPCYEVINPKHIGISPGAKSFEDAVYVFWKRPVATASLQQAYPELDITPDSDISGSSLMNAKESGKFKFFLTDPNNSAFMGFTTGGTKLSGKNKGKHQTWLTTFYYRDPEKIDLTTDEDLKKWIDDNPGFGNSKSRQRTFDKLKVQLPMTVKLYPFGRKIQKANDLILEDDPNPYPWLEFVDFPMYPDPDEFWAEGIISLIREPVRNIHLISSGLAANSDFVNRPPFWTTSKRWDNNQSFAMEPNQIVPLEMGTTIQPLAIGPMAGKGQMELINFRISEIENVTGLKRTLFGRMPESGAPSGVQLDKLQDAGMGALLHISTRYNESRKQVGERIFWMIQNFMTNSRKMVFINKSENPPQPIQVQLNQPGPNDQFINDVMSGDWEYFVDETHGRPFSQAARFQQMEAAAKAMEKFAPADAAKLMLEASNLPGWSKYAQEIDKRYQMQLQIGMTNAERDRQLKEFAEINKAQSDARKAEAMEVKAGAYVKGLESRGIKDVADAMATGYEQIAEEIMASETTPLAPTPTVTQAPPPPSIPGIGAMPGALKVSQPQPLGGGQG